MSLTRFVYYSAVIGGWTAFLGWLLSELFIIDAHAAGGMLEVAVIAAIVGAAIGAGLNVVGGLANGQWKQMLWRTIPGLVGGGIGGCIGGFLGNAFYAIGLPRALGWMMMGLGIGVIEGLYEKSSSKLRNGLIGGGLGGLIGGFLFDPIGQLIQSETGMSSRATAFVILGICIGALIGLVQVVLKEAWLTVLDGYRSGRQLILSQPITVLGRAEHLPLPFLGPMSQDLQLEHTRIVRQPNGTFVIEEIDRTVGTNLNGQRVGPLSGLKDGDIIKLGKNSIRFNERHKKGASVAPPVQPPPVQQRPKPQLPSIPGRGRVGDSQPAPQHDPIAKQSPVSQATEPTVSVPSTVSESRSAKPVDHGGPPAPGPAKPVVPQPGARPAAADQQSDASGPAPPPATGTTGKRPGPPPLPGKR